MGITVISSGMSSGGVTLDAFDEWKVLSGGTVTDVTVADQGNLYVAAGAVASGTVVYSGGGDFVTGFAAGTVLSGGAEYVQGGVATGTVVNADGAEFCAGGGVAYATALNADGAQYLSGGGAEATVVSAGAAQFVAAGGVADGTQVQSGGVQEIFSGGVASGTIVYAGGMLVVLPGGSAVSAIVSPGGALVSTGVVVNTPPTHVLVDPGSASGLVIGAAATDYVLTGGIALNAVISSGGEQFIDPGGIASGTSVLAGGYETVSAGTAYATTVSGADAAAHSFQNVAAGGITSATQVEAGGGQNVAGGTAYGTTLDAGAQYVNAGAARGTQVNGGGYQYIHGGSAVATFVAAGGSENVSGGTAYDTLVATGGHAAAGFGGILVSATLSGGQLYLGPDGAAITTTVGSGGILVLQGGTATGTQVNSGGAVIVSGNSQYSAAVSQDSGTVIAAGGSELVGSQGIVSNVTVGGALGFVSGGAAAGAITFISGGQMFIDQSEIPQAVISGFTAGDAITFAAIISAPGDSLRGSGGLVMVSAGGAVYDLNFAAEPGILVLGADAEGDLVLTENPPCFTAGTHILTPQGGVPVERLAIGCAVLTQAGDAAPVIWIGRRRLDIASHPRPEQVRPIRIIADALADGVPARDLLVSPDHALFLNGVLIPAKALLNGRNVKQIDLPAVTYYHVELATHDVIFAENCPVESYLETGNRAAFENAVGAATLHPDFAQTLREANSCAPFTETGPQVDSVALRLLQRHYAAAALCSSPFLLNSRQFGIL
jgi:autotransporter passenger strand-loop-strand repeat protein